MPTKDENDIKFTLLKSIAYEEVVSYRNRFLSYWAVPIFILAIGSLCLLGWWVRIPERVTFEAPIVWVKEVDTYVVRIDRNSILSQLDLSTQPIVQILSEDKVQSVNGHYLDEHSVAVAREQSKEWAIKIKENSLARVEVITLGDRFIVKLFEDLRSNLKAKSVE